MADRLETRGLAVAGMIVTGVDGVAVETAYPHGLLGRAIVRRELDWSLLQHAIAAGAEFEPLTSVRRALVEENGDGVAANGVVVNDDRTIRAHVVIAADGRHSTLAFGLGLAKHPDHPRRWAIGAYFENVSGLSSFGEMHVRRHSYIGVAAVPGGLTNVCLVKPSTGPDVTFRDPEVLLRRELARDPILRERFTAARLVTPPVVLGPLAVDVSPAAIPGLLLAGDAAGFIDPMTGDGLRFAVRGGELAARAALHALAHGWSGVHGRLERERRSEFATKWRFNRTLRTFVSSPAAIRIGEAVALLAPSALRAVVRRAGDCDVSEGRT
jgi:flavin-dependent dehydrogenase